MDRELVGRFVSGTDFTSYEDFMANFRITAPTDFNFGFDVVDYRAEREPDKKAIVWCDDSTGGERVFTFGEVRTYSDRAAAFLRRIGVRKGDVVMLIMKRRYEFWFCLVALHKIGAIAAPGSYLLTGRDIVYRNNAADVKAIITCHDDHVMDAVDESQAQSPNLKHKIVVHDPRPSWHDLSAALSDPTLSFARPTGPDAAGGDDPLAYWFTSGTTGMPKMVQHSHVQPLGHILTAGYWQRVLNNGLHLTVADTGWAKSAWGSIYGQWICGSAIFAYDYEGHFDAHKLLSAMEKHRVTTFCGPATVYRMLVKQDLSNYDLGSLTHLCVAGEPLYPEVFNAVRDALGLLIHEGFGQSETCVVVANFAPWVDPKPGSMGKPSPGYDVDIIDEHGASCKTGEHGEIIFRVRPDQPVGMFTGYHRDPELNEFAWRDGIYHTGDVAYRDEDGYFWFVARLDDAIKSSGYKIGPFEVESVLQEHPAVHECAITGVPDPIRGQAVKATIVLAEGYMACEDLKVELQDHVKQATAPYKYPRVVEFVDALPKTTSGKISRSTIKRTDYENVAASST
jgi:acetyl-CoA synthetase